MSRISSFFHASMSAGSPNENIRTRDTRLAACALLLELAHADHEFTDTERIHIHAAVGRQFRLDPREAAELLELADKERESAGDVWQFTSLIKENYSRGQKIVLLEIMWGLVWADGQLARREEYLMRKICDVLDVEAGYLAETRRRAGGPGDRAISA